MISCVHQSELLWLSSPAPPCPASNTTIGWRDHADSSKSGQTFAIVACFCASVKLVNNFCSLVLSSSLAWLSFMKVSFKHANFSLSAEFSSFHLIQEIKVILCTIHVGITLTSLLHPSICYCLAEHYRRQKQIDQMDILDEAHWGRHLISSIYKNPRLPFSTFIDMRDI